MKKKMMLLCSIAFAMSPWSAAAESDLEKELSDFYLPGGAAPKTPLRVLLADFKKSYETVSEKTGHSPLEFTFEIDGDPIYDPGETWGGDATPVGRSALATIRRISLQSGRKLTFEGDKISLKEVPDGEELVKKSYPVTPALFRAASSEFNCGLIEVDPSNEESTKTRDLLLKSELLAKNVLHDPETRLVFHDDKSILEVEGTTAEHAAMAEFVQIANSVRPIQVRVTTRAVTGEQDLEFKTGTFEALEIQNWMRGASQAKGVDIVTFPSIVMLPGQSARVNLGRNLSNFSDENFVGVQIDCRAHLYGKGVKLEFDYERRLLLDGDKEIGSYGLEDLDEVLATARKTGSIPETRKRELDGEGFLVDGTTLIRNTDGNSNKTEYISLTAERIDATGRRIVAAPWE